jgi:hypothetical protein
MHRVGGDEPCAALRYAFRDVLTEVQPHTLECLATDSMPSNPMVSATLPRVSALLHTRETTHMPPALTPLPPSRSPSTWVWVVGALVIGALLAALVTWLCRLSADSPMPAKKHTGRQAKPSFAYDEDTDDYEEDIVRRLEEEYDDDEDNVAAAPPRRIQARTAATAVRPKAEYARGAQRMPRDPRDVFGDDASPKESATASGDGSIPVITETGDGDDPNFQPLRR